jgi:hypothetical protein
MTVRHPPRQQRQQQHRPWRGNEHHQRGAFQALPTMDGIEVKRFHD